MIADLGIKAFVNLEGGGSGGRAILFRSTSEDLSRMYADVAPFPHMNDLGGALIGLLGSSTDYETFTKSGLHGVDIAFYERRDRYTHFQLTWEIAQVSYESRLYSEHLPKVTATRLILIFQLSIF